MHLLLLLACADDPTSGRVDPTDGPGAVPPSSSSSSDDTGDATVPPSGPIDLSALFGGRRVERAQDLGGDGADDLVMVRSRSDGAYTPTTQSGLELWPDVLAGEPTLFLTSPERDVDDYLGISIGLVDLAGTPDVTGDGVADVWLLGSTGTPWRLLPGPLDQDIADPSLGEIATLERFGHFSPTDLDGDGVGEVVGGYGSLLRRCEGPFDGPVAFEVCPTATLAEWSTARVLWDDDIDGDGISDLLVSLEGRVVGPGEALGVGEFTVLDGAFPDGADAGRLTVVPGYDLARDGLLEDLDGDGYGDIVWVDVPNWSPSPPGEISVIHGPLADGAELGHDDATLRLAAGVLPGGADTPGLQGVADPDGDGVPSLLLVGSSGLLLTDASGSGSVDPEATATVLAPGSNADDAEIGDFDRDGLDDVLVTEWFPGGAWLYLGARMP